MRKLEKDWEKTYESVTGQLEDGNSDGCEVYDRAWQEIYDARAHLCQRFGMDWEDADMEQILNAILTIEKDIARRMFLCGR